MARIIIVIMVAVLVLTSCSVRKTVPGTPEEGSTAGGPRYDPMATMADREVVPEVYPIAVAAVPVVGDSLVQPRSSGYKVSDSGASDLNPREVFRIQVFTSRLFTEASREQGLAEEIFNLPVHLDYELPYYKLRIGDFVKRGEAEDMLPEIRAIGYRDAWVARVIQKIREVPPFMMSDDPILPLDSVGFLPAKPDSQEIDGEDEDL